MTTQHVGIVLAAGKGTRMKSRLPKVLHPVLGKPMLQRVLESFSGLGFQKVFIIIGHGADEVKNHVSSLKLPFEVAYVVQEPQLGTGHALQQVLPHLPEKTDAQVLITCGDMPLVLAESYETLWKSHQKTSAVASLVTVSMPNPFGYGRVISKNEKFEKIVEEKDASPEEKACPWVNTGIYCVNWQAFSPYLNKLTDKNAQKEFYLTDVLGLLVSDKKPVDVVEWNDPDEVLGINSREHLSEADGILSRRSIKNLMVEGVSFINPCASVVSPEVVIGRDSIVHPGCYLTGNVSIGENCEIGPQTTMRGDIQIAQNCKVVYSYLDRAVTVGENSYLGPFAHMRDNAVVGNTTRIGNFVEVKEVIMGDRSNAAHLCYLGDAEIGSDVNMGAGSIIANYDPIRDIKSKTTIADGVKVGCNSVLVSPITVAERACVAAGSVITQDVGAWDLAIARAKQVDKARWVEKTLSQPVD